MLPLSMSSRRLLPAGLHRSAFHSVPQSRFAALSFPFLHSEFSARSLLTSLAVGSRISVAQPFFFVIIGLAASAARSARRCVSLCTSSGLECSATVAWCVL